MRALLTVIKEQIDHFYLIRRLSIYELKSQNRNNYLGMAWEVINPSIQILIYWFVFGTIRQREPLEVGGMEVPFILWLIAGFILWNFFYQATIQGSRSIYVRLRMLSKMNFPMSIIPSFIITSKFYIHLAMLGITVIIFQFSGFYLTVYFLQIIYFVFATFCLVFAISLITSTLSTIVRDVHMLLNASLRMVLYVSPILWQVTEYSLPGPVAFIMKLNPLFYLIEGYRSALFGVDWYFIVNWEYTLYFWVFVFVLLWIGSSLHVRFRRHFIDYL